ncbi:hypothetical protein DIZ81_11015 [Legionella taurinensis]|uniref:SidE PDE domain-containing protein n=1 Tax=Legionella taurinensis TaxID=70611 RepID=A0A3A5LAZ8_9GAMM|nr:SidE phosphodiesterase domain-containing protein [Legionella taurinensis]MDX1838381.1 SidE phosphodiesterase domain-containing protein [Legionella taurinensis]PUT39141.1 hypothetical protein DB744_11025 [Legionella taurinensis]PUT39766.1 hypothetical protein DB746_13200 [Legionella taurinensis]PUT43597.1 hypothetical protein DB743_10415 [Legionella taurinensis]PUT45253.1 hypothetical protein DB745_13140 [Legionella taurinensis]
MLKIQTNRLSSEIFELRVNDHFARYVSRTEMDELELKIRHFADETEENPLLSFNPSVAEPLVVDLSRDDEARLLDLLLHQQKKPIDFPEELTLSKENKYPVIVTYSDLSEFKYYWQDQKAGASLLWQQLSRELIEHPYLDDPHNYEVRHNKIAFHINHGTASGLRTMILVRSGWALLKQWGSDEVKTLAKNLGTEELNCLQLASFLLRSGRTNELSWDDDPSYSPRSAYIFTTIAHELGYDPELIKDISECFDFDKELTSGDDESLSKRRHRKTLYQTLLKLAHQAELVRCKSKLEVLATKISSLFNELLLPTSPISHLATQFLLFAAVLCKNTGSPVLPKELRETLSMGFANPVLAVHCANDVGTTLKNLTVLGEEFVFHFDCKSIADATTHPQTLYLSLGIKNTHEKEEIALKDTVESNELAYSFENAFFSLPEKVTETKKEPPSILNSGMV